MRIAAYNAYSQFNIGQSFGAMRGLQGGGSQGFGSSAPISGGASGAQAPASGGGGDFPIQGRAITGSADVAAKFQVHTEQEAKDADLSEAEIRGLKKSGVIECTTCADRKYQDGSDEEVSFKSAAHIDPQASAARVRAHEQEHVANAYDKAKEKGGKVLQASVAIQTAVCPECGRTYVAGGLTTTRIAYPKGKYGEDSKSKDAASGLVGSSVDFRV